MCPWLDFEPLGQRYDPFLGWGCFATRLCKGPAILGHFFHFSDKSSWLRYMRPIFLCLAVFHGF